MKLDHSQKNTFDVMGMTEQAFEEMINSCVDIHNDAPSITEGAEGVIRKMQKEVLDNNPAEVTEYEMKLAITMYGLGAKASKSGTDAGLVRLLEVLLMMKKDSVEADVAIDVTTKIVATMLGIDDGDLDGHECTDCGGCGKGKDEEGKS